MPADAIVMPPPDFTMLFPMLCCLLFRRFSCVAFVDIRAVADIFAPVSFD